MTLNEPLPPELTGRHGWLTRYRRYPVFSPPWAAGRLRSLGLMILLGVALMLLPLLVWPPEQMPTGALVHMTVQALLPMVAGPWLGCWVRRQGWPAAREGLALVAVVVGVMALVLAFHEYAAEPAKQWLAEQVGQVDDTGKRRKVMMSIGVVVRAADEPASAAQHGEPRPADGSLPQEVRAANAISSALLSFWLAGGAALWGWQRERLGLAALARERELARAIAQRREAELKLSVLAAQVEPHFLFNTLAGVRSAIATDPDRASTMIDQLVDYLRAAIPRLRSDGSAQATVGGQFEIVRAYLGLMSARMPRLQTLVQAPPDLLQARCPPLMLISLAENAVKHGVEPKMGAAQVQVLAERTADGQLALSVLDDGVGFSDSTAGSGLGLSNIRERLAQLYGDRASLTLKARPQGGVAATLTLPLETS
jgi:signal transduction histidine kinase